jgi:hypothetical protein
VGSKCSQRIQCCRSIHRLTCSDLLSPLCAQEWHENHAPPKANGKQKHVLGACSHSFSEKKLQKVVAGKAKFGHAPGSEGRLPLQVGEGAIICYL